MALLKFKTVDGFVIPKIDSPVLLIKKENEILSINPDKVDEEKEGCIVINIKDEYLNDFLETDSINLKTYDFETKLISVPFEDGDQIKDIKGDVLDLSENDSNEESDNNDSSAYSGDIRYWMHAMYDKLKDKRLTEIAIPGTHNSGVFSAWNTIAYRCQKADINEQLHMGVRAFDIRITKNDSNFYMHHNGKWYSNQSLEHLLSSLKKYMQDFLNEVIIIDLTRGCGSNLTEDDFREVKRRFVSELRNYMYPSNIKNLENLYFKDLINSQKRIVVVSENITLNTPDDNLFWNYNNIYNTWTSEQQDWTITMPRKMDLLKKHINQELNNWINNKSVFVIYSFNIWALNIRESSARWERYHLNDYFDGTPRDGIRIAVFDFIEDKIIRGVIACNR